MRFVRLARLPDKLVFVCLSVRPSVTGCVCVCLCIHTYTYIYVCVSYTHTHTRIYIYTTHTHVGILRCFIHIALITSPTTFSTLFTYHTLPLYLRKDKCILIRNITWSMKFNML